MLGAPEIILIIIAILILFGGTKIPELMKGLGKGMKEFNNMNKDSLKQVIEQGFKDVEKLKKSNN